MPHQTIAADAALYESDETAWLELASELIRDRRVSEIDLDCLADYLLDMAKRDRREVNSRLVVLMAHALKWTFQPDMRSRSWQSTVAHQRRELRQIFTSRVLRNHAEAELPELYREAVGDAAIETGLAANAFPADCPYTVDALLLPELLADAG